MLLVWAKDDGSSGDGKEQLDSRLDHGGSSGDGKEQLDSRLIWKQKQIGILDGLDMQCGKEVLRVIARFLT